jgi:GNAT superfamily N-acetyltransferase
MQITVRKISQEATRLLRQQLLRQGVPLEQLMYTGDMEIDTLHIGAFAQGEQVGIATVMCQPPNISVGVPPIHPDPDNSWAWRLRGMAVTEDMRRAGVGAMMLKACIGYAASQDGAFIWCDARILAADFYRSNGFQAIGKQYTVPNVGPHYFMQRNIVPGDVALLDFYLTRMTDDDGE